MSAKKTTRGGRVTPKGTKPPKKTPPTKSTNQDSDVPKRPSNKDSQRPQRCSTPVVARAAEAIADTSPRLIDPRTPVLVGVGTCLDDVEAAESMVRAAKRRDSIPQHQSSYVTSNASPFPAALVVQRSRSHRRGRRRRRRRVHRPGRSRHPAADAHQRGVGGHRCRLARGRARRRSGGQSPRRAGGHAAAPPPTPPASRRSCVVSATRPARTRSTSRARRPTSTRRPRARSCRVPRSKRVCGRRSSSTH